MLEFLLYNMFNNSTQRLPAVTTSISPTVKPRGNQLSSIHLRVLYLALFLGSPSFLNLGQKTGQVSASAQVSLLNGDITD